MIRLALQMGISDLQMDKVPIWRANVINEIWLILNYSKVVWDIFLKFSPFVHHMFVLIWWKNLTVAQSACPQRPISAQLLDGSTDRNCWNFFSKKILVRVSTNISCLSEGILNILKKTAFSNFSKAFISRFSELLV